MQRSSYPMIDTDIQGGIPMVTAIKKQVKNEKGLTLIELLAVLVIIAIIAAIAVPAIGNIIENSRIKAVKSDAINILNAANIYYTDNNGSAAIDSATTTEFTGKYLQSSGKITTYTVTNVTPYAITATVNLPGGVTVAFNGATLADIDASKATSDGTSPNFKVTVTKP